jgi:hypothetical protein
LSARRHLACLAVALAAGCGFTGEPPFAGRRAEGVAPFRDLGPLTICDGAVRAASPSATAGGLCVDPQVPLARCASDADCRSRERCTCAGCQVALCDSVDECRADQVCSFSDRRCDRPCAADGDCAAGELCLPGVGVCRGRCGGDGDCQGGEHCTGGRCASEACAGPGDCTSAPSCAIQRMPEGLAHPSPLAESGGVTLWLERASAIVRATSPDGLRFQLDPAQPLVSPGAGDGGRAGSPSVLRTGAAYLLAFADGNGALRRATSPDGVSFAVDPQPLLTPAGTWDAAGLDAPALAAAPNGGVLLYYGTRDRAAIGLAESQDGVAFTAAASPLLRPADVADPLLWRDLDAIAAPFAESAPAPDGSFALRLYFCARGRESGDGSRFGATVPEAPNFSIGEAGTIDGPTLVPWPYDPAFDRVQSFLVHPSELDPAVVTVGDHRLLYYRDANPDESKPGGLNAAQNP